MTRGISEEKLHEVLHKMKSETNLSMWFTQLLVEVKEINQWKPIDSCEKLGMYLIFDGKYIRIASWYADTINKWLDRQGREVIPTHWMELPENPK
jgi:ATP phosphoribosyltransferase